MEDDGVMTVRNTEIVQAWAEWYNNAYVEPDSAWSDCVAIGGINPTSWFDEYCDEYDIYAVCSNYSPYFSMYEVVLIHVCTIYSPYFSMYRVVLINETLQSNMFEVVEP